MNVTLIGRALALIRKPLALVGEALTHLLMDLPLVGGTVSFVGGSLAVGGVVLGGIGGHASTFAPCAERSHWGTDRLDERPRRDRRRRIPTSRWVSGRVEGPRLVGTTRP